MAKLRAAVGICAGAFIFASCSGGGGGAETGTGGAPGTGGASATGGQSGASGGGGASAGGTTGAGGTGGTSTGGTTRAGGTGGSGGSALGGTGGAPGLGGNAGGQGGSSGAGGQSSAGGQSGAGAGGQAGATAAGNPWITFDPAGIVSRSNIVLTKANTDPTQSMPMGNGALGVAVWAANGLTIQLNRDDTFPQRKSPGQVTIPGLATLTGASDFKGTLDLYNSELKLSGGGMTAKIYVRADADELIVDVTGAAAGSTQTASVGLWGSRKPTGATTGAIATLAESWADSGLGSDATLKFGTLAALTAGGQNVKASASGQTATVTFQPNASGAFRVVCGSPSYNGATAAATAASTLLGSDATSTTLEATHTAWWHAYWGRVGLVKMTSTDGTADYVENLRTIYLYASASLFRGTYPGSHAGVADLFNFSQDKIAWYAGGYWFWNIRMMVAANLGSGAFDMNLPIYNLYLSNLTNIEAWTKARMGNRVGVCVPETMRFNGNGWYNSDGDQSCDQTIAPTWNSLTLSSGSEVGLWVWRYYLMTQDATFLETNFPLMLEAARFLYTYATTDSSGKLYMSPSNAHETQWGVTDPITDVSAMKALFPAVVAAASVVGSTDSLIANLKTAIASKLPDLPRTDSKRTQVLTPSSDSGSDIFAYSTEPSAQGHNSENIDLEPVWPYDIVNDATDAAEFAVGKRTYSARATKNGHDWSSDAIDAARLGLGSEVAADITAQIASYQYYPSGFAVWETTSLDEPYVEQLGVFATAVNEALVQGFDGLIRVAPGWPSGWTASGTVFVQGKSKVDVQYASGAVAFAVLEAGTTATVRVRNPWGTTAVSIIDSATNQVVGGTMTSATLSIAAQAGHFYLIKKASDATPATVKVTGTAATAPKKLGSRAIGL